MRLGWIAAAVLASACATASGENARPLTPAALMPHIEVLASDEFEGRGVATPGEQLTVDYLVSQFQALGLEPGGPDGQWVQASGPKNSLGIVKFDMKNDHAIYLHDTPAKALFAEDERHRSHGCVRVENAMQFAHMLARADGVDAEFSKAMASGKETFVELNTQIPVRLLYHTAWLGDDGRVHFADDAYGWDNDVATALGYPTKAPTKRQKRAGDIGP